MDDAEDMEGDMREQEDFWKDGGKTQRSNELQSIDNSSLNQRSFWGRGFESRWRIEDG